MRNRNLLAFVFFLSLLSCAEDETLVPAEPIANIPSTSFDFGAIVIEESADTQTLQIENLGVADLTVTLTLSSDFASSGFSGPTDQQVITIGPRESEAIELGFSPKQAGPAQASITVSTNDQYNPSLTVNVEGVGLVPGLCVQPEQVNFGDVQVGGIATRSLTVENCGDTELSVASVMRGSGSSSRYSVSNLPELPFTMQPGDKKFLEVQFAPSEEGLVEDTITFVGTELESSVVVTMTGNGTPPPLCFSFTPEPLDMGTALPGEVLSSTVTMKNCSDQASSWIDRIRIVGTSSGAFTVADAPIPVEIRPGGEMQIRLNFSAEAEAEYFAKLQVLDGNNIIVGTVNLKAAIEPVCAINPTCCGPTCNRTWELVNDGTFDRYDADGQPLQWTVALEDPNDSSAQVLGSDGMFSNVLEINNPVNDADGDWDRVYQLTGVKVENCGKLIFTADGKAMEQTLTGAGRTSGEFPVHFRVFYKDAEGMSRRWQHGLYYNGMHDPMYDAIATKVSRNTWSSYISLNLMDIDPPPAEIVRVEVGASGWSYRGRIDNVSLMASEPKCP